VGGRPQADARRFERILDPSAVMELGYASHVADDPLSAGTQAHRLARLLVDDLMRMRARAGSDDVVYLFKARAIVLSLGRGITRRKLTYRIDIGAANEFHDAEIARVDRERVQSLWATLAYRPLISGGMGFALMASLLPLVHLHLEHGDVTQSVGGVAPSLLMALVFAAASKVAFSKLEDFRYRGIMQRFDLVKLQAIHRYEAGKLKEFERKYGEIRRVWCEYTGRVAPHSVTFGTIIADDIRT
jgi:hypothetical protein